MRFRTPASWIALPVVLVHLCIVTVLVMVWLIAWYPAIMAPELIEVLKVSGAVIAIMTLLATLALITCFCVRGGSAPLLGVLAGEAFLMTRYGASGDWWSTFGTLALCTVAVVAMDVLMPTIPPRPRPLPPVYQRPYGAQWAPQQRPAPGQFTPQQFAPQQWGPPQSQHPPSVQRPPQAPYPPQNPQQGNPGDPGNPRNPGNSAPPR